MSCKYTRQPAGANHRLKLWNFWRSFQNICGNIMGNSKLARHRFSWWIFYGFIFTLSCPCLDREVVFSSPVLLLEVICDMEQQEEVSSWQLEWPLTLCVRLPAAKLYRRHVKTTPCHRHQYVSDDRHAMWWYEFIYREISMLYCIEYLFRINLTRVSWPISCSDIWRKS